MTEGEWVACADQKKMLEFIADPDGRAVFRRKECGIHRITVRQLRLFACALCRAVWDRLTDERSRRAVEVAERYADGEATEQERTRAVREMFTLDLCPWPLDHAAWACLQAADLIPAELDGWRELPPADQAALLRDVVGNPFAGVSADPRWLAWREGTVPALARFIYDGRRFDLMPTLSDALEDAGAPDGELLRHLRGPGPHCRGCWATDLLAGRTQP